MNPLATDLVPIIAQEAETGGSILAFLFPLLILGGLFYVFILMPQRRRQKKQAEMQAEIGMGDEIRTIGGLMGTIVEEDDTTFVLRIEEGRIRILRRAVAEKVSDVDESGDEA